MNTPISTDSVSQGPVTIDNLPITEHTRFAIDQMQLEERFVNEAAFIGEISEEIVPAPSFESEFAHLFGFSITNVPWAHFSPPKQRGKKALFSRKGLLPNLHPDQLITQCFDNLNDEELSHGKKRAKERLRKFLDQLKDLEALMHEIYTRISQIQKG